MWNKWKEYNDRHKPYTLNFAMHMLTNKCHIGIFDILHAMTDEFTPSNAINHKCAYL